MPPVPPVKVTSKFVPFQHPSLSVRSPSPSLPESTHVPDTMAHTSVFNTGISVPVDSVADNSLPVPTPSSESGSNSSNACLFNIADLSPSLDCTSLGFLYSFAGNTRVKQLMQIFSVVEIVSVRAFLFQVSTPPTNPEGTVGALLRFGPVPRKTVYSISTSSSGSSKGSTSVAGTIPTLRSIVTSPITPVSASVVWGAGGEPFPPGMQLDLRLVESRFNYINFLLANVNPVKLSGKAESWEVARVQLDFTVSCSGQNFGVIYSEA